MFALLVGINYRNTQSELQGCINDVNSMRSFLLKRGYLPENITVLTEDEDKKPTGINIMTELAKLIMNAHTLKAKEIWFHYSGHGSYTRDRSGDERDGRDETIVPLDYATNGMITDDQLHDYLVHVPKGCKMYCIFDCCHSGTILDLKYQYKGGATNTIENARSTIGSHILLLTGCADVQTSADAFIKGRWAGAMTTAFLEAMKDQTNIPCSLLLDRVRAYLKSNGYQQVAQMCCSNRITPTLQW